MDYEKLKKVLFVLIMLKNKHIEDEKTITCIEEAISYINESLGI